MILTNGARLGPYEILAPIGAGGMGEVYRARDTKLNRNVAIKVLPEMFAADADRLARFEREAQVLASLNHPNIAHLYGFEDSAPSTSSGQGVHALVMELVEGPTLADRIAAGPIALADALPIAKQIAEALEAAHEQGIIHRDLKPANVKVRDDGVVKVLDFGLAKALDPMSSSGAEAMNSPTMTARATQLGMLIGTAAYMSPEQAKGKAADKRADVWAFGAVLYEMITGDRAFKGEDISDTLAAVLRQEIMMSALPATTPLRLKRLIERCLERDPKQRLRDIGEARIEIARIEAGGADVMETPAATSAAPAVAVPRWKRALPWVLAGVTTVALVAALLLWAPWRVPSKESRLMRFIVPAPGKSSFSGTIALSPDGRNLAFVATSGGTASLWLRSLDSISPHVLPGTEDASAPFWSPDGRWIAFFAQGKLKKIEASGGSPQTLCDAADNRGGTWNRDGVIIFSPISGDGLYRVSEDGGAVAQVTKLDPSGSESSHRYPSFLPDGRHFLYLVVSGQPDKRGIFVGSLDSKASKRLLNSISAALYAPPGYLIFMAGGALMSQQFDSARLELEGQSSPLAEQVWNDSAILGLSAFSVSENGILTYRNGSAQNTQFTWFDRNGNNLGTVGAPGRYGEPYFSGEEERIVFWIGNYNFISDLWTMDLASGNISRFTFGPSDASAPLWSPDGERIVWSSNGSGTYDLYQKPASGAGKDELLLKSTTRKDSDDWSLDGKFILYENQDPKTKVDLWVLPMFGERKPMPYLQTQFNEAQARFSPDGKWIAYVSDESGRAEVYVQSFPATGGKWQISTGGGDQPMWRRDGKELFYVAADGKLMATEVNQSGSTFQAGVPRPLFGLHVPFAGITSLRNYYVVTSDGQRFLVNNPIEDAASFPITVVLNWPALLKEVKR